MVATRYHLPMHKLRGTIARLLITVVTAFATLSGFGETPISDPVSARGASYQSRPASATDGRDFLLVWTDLRSGRPAIYGTRVAEDGSVLDPEGIPISDAAEWASSPSVAWTGNSYIVVWQRGLDGCRFRRIAPDGRIDDRAGNVLSGGCQRPRVAGIGGRAVVAASRGYSNGEVEVIESTGAVRTVASTHGAILDVACTRSECWLVWDWIGFVMGRRLGPLGESLGGDRMLALSADGAKIAATRDRFLLTWRDRRYPDPRSQRIWAQELDAESEPFMVTETKRPSIVDMRVAPSGRDFIVAWTQEREKSPSDLGPGIRSDDIAVPYPRSLSAHIEIRARRIDGGENEYLTVAQSNVARFETPSIASNGVKHIAAWIENDSNKVTAAVSSDDGAFSRILVTRTARPQSEPYVVNARDHLLVVWVEELNDRKYSVLARRFRFSGEPLDVHPIVIASTAASQHRPVAAFDGNAYLVAWHESSRVYARRLNRDGSLDAEVLALSGENPIEGTTAVVGTDRGFAVLHTDGRQLILSRIAEGATIERTVVAENRNRSCALSSTGSELVAIWSDANNRVQGARFTFTGLPLGPQILVGFGPQGATSLSLACETSQCVAAWGEFLGGVKTASIGNGWSFLLTEPIPDPPYYRVPSTDRYRPVVLRAGNEFKVISYGPGGALYAQTVRDGVVFSESVLNEPPIEYEDYAIGSIPEGLVTVYSRSASGPGYGGSRRLFMRRQQ